MPPGNFCVMDSKKIKCCNPFRTIIANRNKVRRIPRRRLKLHETFFLPQTNTKLITMNLHKNDRRVIISAAARDLS